MSPRKSVVNFIFSSLPMINFHFNVHTRKPQVQAGSQEEIINILMSEGLWATCSKSISRSISDHCRKSGYEDYIARLHCFLIKTYGAGEIWTHDRRVSPKMPGFWQFNLWAARSVLQRFLIACCVQFAQQTVYSSSHPDLSGFPLEPSPCRTSHSPLWVAYNSSDCY